ncbi:hypothetical protein [Bradyrhizobium guangdongense]|uniref:hypothetical protein n=1 Tax=Bradyrhizobium guangdongense TaxID=1325090 RepID=UPI00112633D3|nr:hypothetical protein [Bradyrhizobium guangdongense]
MDLDEMLKEHQRWLQTAHKSLTSAGALVELTQSRIDQLKAGIAELERQKERDLQRYDAAIADMQGELAAVAPAKNATSRAEKKPAKKVKAKKSKK